MLDFEKIARRKVLEYKGMRLHVKGTDLRVNSLTGTYLIGDISMPDFIRSYEDGLESVRKYVPGLVKLKLQNEMHEHIEQKLVIKRIFECRLNREEISFDEHTFYDFEYIYAVRYTLTYLFKTEPELYKALSVIFPPPLTDWAQYKKYEHWLDMQ